MSSESFMCVGPGEALAYLRGDVRRASKSLLIVGPEVDDRFATEVVLRADRRVRIRLLVRPPEELLGLSSRETRAAIRRIAGHAANSEIRCLSGLAAVCLVVDDCVLYLGSEAWSAGSLEKDTGIVIRAAIEAVGGATELLERLWERARPLDGRDSSGDVTRAEVVSKAETDVSDMDLDPLARRALQENPKAFVLGKKPRPRGGKSG
ncbi:MAG: hypothetical protein KatS3mg109_1141 [Pirellulaceae bacterium]|nr:MAG: hypothetical protein KatS3mg109_1141 [Pirellulaceae bacterium]